MWYASGVRLTQRRNVEPNITIKCIIQSIFRSINPCSLINQIYFKKMENTWENSMEHLRCGYFGGFLNWMVAATGGGRWRTNEQTMVHECKVNETVCRSNEKCCRLISIGWKREEKVTLQNRRWRRKKKGLAQNNIGWHACNHTNIVSRLPLICCRSNSRSIWMDLIKHRASPQPLDRPNSVQNESERLNLLIECIWLRWPNLNLFALNWRLRHLGYRQKISQRAHNARLVGIARSRLKEMMRGAHLKTKKLNVFCGVHWVASIGLPSIPIIDKWLPFIHVFVSLTLRLSLSLSLALLLIPKLPVASQRPCNLIIQL